MHGDIPCRVKNTLTYVEATNNPLSTTNNIARTEPTHNIVCIIVAAVAVSKNLDSNFTGHAGCSSTDAVVV